MTLAEFFFAGMTSKDSDEIEIMQTTETLRVTLRSSGTVLRSITFTNTGWEQRPDGFDCPFVVPTGLRNLYFHAQRDVRTFDGVKNTDYRKAADGSLVVKVAFFGSSMYWRTNNVWYRFPPIRRTNDAHGVLH